MRPAVEVILGDYVITAIYSRQKNNLKVDGREVSLKMNRKKSNKWIDSGFPIFILTMRELSEGRF